MAREPWMGPGMRTWGSIHFCYVHTECGLKPNSGVAFTLCLKRIECGLNGHFLNKEQKCLHVLMAISYYPGPVHVVCKDIMYYL